MLGAGTCACAGRGSRAECRCSSMPLVKLVRLEPMLASTASAAAPTAPVRSRVRREIRAAPALDSAGMWSTLAPSDSPSDFFGPAVGTRGEKRIARQRCSTGQEAHTRTVGNRDARACPCRDRTYRRVRDRSCVLRLVRRALFDRTRCLLFAARRARRDRHRRATYASRNAMNDFVNSCSFGASPPFASDACVPPKMVTKYFGALRRIPTRTTARVIPHRLVLISVDRQQRRVDAGEELAGGTRRRRRTLGSQLSPRSRQHVL